MSHGWKEDSMLVKFLAAYIFNHFWDIASYWSKIATCSYPTSVYSVPAGDDPVGISWRCLMLVKLEWLGYRTVEFGEKKLWRYVKPFAYNTSVLRTDRRTELLYQYRASASMCWRAIKIALVTGQICVFGRRAISRNMNRDCYKMWDI